MIECPNCNHQNMAGAAFCTECGVALLTSDTLTTLKIEPRSSSKGGRPKPHAVPGLAAAGDNWATLHLLESGHLVPLSTRNEFTIGRVAAGQPVMPDIDLTPFQAYAHGVSRLHAVIRRGLDAVSLTDLDSANGTFLNGRRLKSSEQCPLSNGDVMALGGLKIQILLKSP